jgi:hypothetical protein
MIPNDSIEAGDGGAEVGSFSAYRGHRRLLAKVVSSSLYGAREMWPIVCSLDMLNVMNVLCGQFVDALIGYRKRLVYSQEAQPPSSPV